MVLKDIFRFGVRSLKFVNCMATDIEINNPDESYITHQKKRITYIIIQRDIIKGCNFSLLCHIDRWDRFPRIHIPIWTH